MLGEGIIKRLRFGGFMAAVVLLLCSCGKPAKVASLPGEWTDKFSYGIEKVSLKANNHYEHSFTYTNGNVIRCEGDWSYVESNGSLYLNDILMVHELGYQAIVTKPSKTCRGLKVVDYGNGRVHLIIDSDGSHYFEPVTKE